MYVILGVHRTGDIMTKKERKEITNIKDSLVAIRRVLNGVNTSIEHNEVANGVIVTYAVMEAGDAINRAEHLLCKVHDQLNLK